MKSKRLLVVLGTIFLVLVMGLVPIIGACAKPAPTPTPTPTIETLKIGCSLPLNKTYGVAAKEWYDVIIPAFNEAGGLVIKGQRYNIDLIIENDQYTAEAGKAAAEKLVYVDKVKYIIGTIGAESTNAMLSVTEPNKVILITAGGSEKILGPDVKYGLHFAGGTGLEPSNWGYVKENYTGIKTYLLTVPDTEAGRNKVAREIPCAKIVGAKEAGPTLFYSATETDFGPFATKVKSYQPDMVLFDTTPSPSVFGLQLKELYKSGWRGLKVQTSSFDIAQVVAVCGNEAIEGTVININVADIEPPMNQIISTRKAACTKKYGKFSSEGIAWTTCFDVFIAAMKKADSLEPDDILAALSGLTGETQQGHFMCVKRPDQQSDRVCDAMFDYYMGVVENGKLVFKNKLSPEGRLAACEAAWDYAGKWR
jgi:branched-chain amino acid transport system substrate-binding protein